MTLDARLILDLDLFRIVLALDIFRLIVWCQNLARYANGGFYFVAITKLIRPADAALKNRSA
jgi:hypothetical protein